MSSPTHDNPDNDGNFIDLLLDSDNCGIEEEVDNISLEIPSQFASKWKQIKPSLANTKITINSSEDNP